MFVDLSNYKENMNKIILFLSLLLIILVSFIKYNETNYLRDLDQNSFKRGEYLQYDVSYGFFNAAKATLEIDNNIHKINNRNSFRIIGKGKSSGTLRWFFKVDDRYETYVDEKSILPHKFIRRVREGNYSLDREINFNQYTKKAIVYQKDTQQFNIDTNSQDLLSTLYYARTLDLNSAKIDQEFIINTFFDKQMYPLKIRFLGKEDIETDLGEFSCLKFRPLLQEGRVFKEQEDMTIWISDDLNKIPIRLKTNLLVGSIKMDLVKFRNLKHKLEKIK
tara:strand:- start:831 stop:1661 length:831 start_codon:yes stop_codon:yes gene_type:complete